MRTFISSAVISLSALAAQAEVAGWQSLEWIRTAASNYAQGLAPSGSRVTAGSLDPRLLLPACTGDLQASGSTASANAATVAVSCPAPVWTVYVPVRIVYMRPVVVLQRAVGRGAPIGAEDIAMQERDVSVSSQGYFTEAQQVLGKTLKRPLAPGSVLSPDLVTAPTLIKRGELVTLIGRAGPVEVRAEAKALTDGIEGERIEVQNTGSRRVLGGTVRGPGLVEVNL